jgi:hypothetical protein
MSGIGRAGRCGVDFMGFAIMTVALPTIQRDLHFSQQNL